MTIIGLTDNIQPRYPRLGKLRKGGERPASGKAPGEDLDHFRFASDNEDITRAFLDAYGETPRLINVYLPYAAPADAFPTWAEIWGATGLVHRCDGKMMSVWLENGKYLRGEKPCTGGHKDNDYLKDAVGRLDVVIPELVMAGYVGYVTLETHGKHDILSILSTLQAVSDNGRHDLRGVPFVLRRVQESVSAPGFGNQAGKRSRVNKWLVKLEPSASWVQLQIGLASAPVAELPEASDTDDTGVVDATSAPAPQLEAPKPSEKAAEKPAEKQPQPAQKQADPKAALEARKEKINALGKALWPGGSWEEKKAALAKAFTVKGVVDLEKVFEFLEQREKEISDLTQLENHIKNSWPGMEILPVMVTDFLKSDKFSRGEFLSGVAKAAAAQKANPKIDDTGLMNICIAELSETEIPEMFR